MTRSSVRKDKLQTNLRFGWTTGTCATAAVNAAYTALVTGEFPDRVTIITPSGKNADLEVVNTERGTEDDGAKVSRGVGASWFRPVSSRMQEMILM